jgi:hypothetical protein
MLVREDFSPGSFASLLPPEFAELSDDATLVEKILADKEADKEDVVGGRETVRHCRLRCRPSRSHGFQARRLDDLPEFLWRQR